MVHDLKFESHPGKLLEDHIRGVHKGTLLNSSIPIAELAALFHDLGKINPNFQNKLYGKSKGYSNHSYLSVIAWVNYVPDYTSLIYFIAFIITPLIVTGILLFRGADSQAYRKASLWLKLVMLTGLGYMVIVNLLINNMK